MATSQKQGEDSPTMENDSSLPRNPKILVDIPTIEESDDELHVSIPLCRFCREQRPIQTE